MVVRVDFALGASSRLRTACEAVRKQYLAGRRLIIYHSDSKELQRFDRMLWGFEPTAFVPHVLITDAKAALTPIWLCQDAAHLPAQTDTNQWLLNLCAQGPPLPSQFSRILEIVSHQETDKQQARQRWRLYQQQGYNLHSHHL